MNSTKKIAVTASDRLQLDGIVGLSWTDIGCFRRKNWIAERLGVAPRTVARWAERGLITRFKLNPRFVLHDVREIIELIESGRIKSETACVRATISAALEGGTGP